MLAALVTLLILFVWQRVEGSPPRLAAWCGVGLVLA